MRLARWVANCVYVSAVVVGARRLRGSSYLILDLVSHLRSSYLVKENKKRRARSRIVDESYELPVLRARKRPCVG